LRTEDDTVLRPTSTLLILAVVLPSLVPAVAQAYEEPRDLSLNAEGLHVLAIRSGAGSLRVTGIAGTGTIVAKAHIRVAEADPEAARQIIERDLELRLVREGQTAVLEARFDPEDTEGAIELEVTLPQAMALDAEDGSGSIEIVNVRGDIDVDDGSGEIVLRDVGGKVTVDDGSGSLSVEEVGGDLEITDASGEVSVRSVQGSVRIEDGSGDLTVSDVAGDLDIPESGSGSVEVSGVAGRVRRDDG
jgi:hypothetical protein